MAVDPPSDGRFRPGQSGNPTGMSKAEVNLRRLARERTPEAVETLVKIMLNEKAASAARVSAATALLDRGWGKPIQPTAFTDLDGNDRPLPIDALTRLDLARRIAHSLAEGMKALPVKQPAELEHASPDDPDTAGGDSDD